MTFNIHVRSFRGLSRADIRVVPLAVIGGRNEAGKTSLAQAIRALLTQDPIPVPGVNKKDAKLLVADGAKGGSAEITWGDHSTTVEWPKCKVTESADNAIWASAYAVGATSLLDVPEKDRGKVLSGYVDCSPSITDLMKACADAGYGEKAAEQMWESIQRTGWDDVHKRAREHSTKLKGQWEGITGEKYGAVKAESWAPVDLPAGKAGADDVAMLESTVRDCQAELERRIAAEAVSAADTDRLRELAGQQGRLEKAHAEAEAAAKEARTAFQNIVKGTVPTVPEPTMHCPECGTMLDVHDGALVSSQSPVSQEAVSEATAKVAEWRKRKDDAEATFNAAHEEQQSLYRKLVDARQAATQLKELATAARGNTDVAAAREALALAQQSLSAIQKYEAAKKLHAGIEKNNKLVDVLAPTGIRQQKLVKALEGFNARLSDLCKAAKWPVVAVGEDLGVTYGTRPVWAASASGQWRARTILQVAMALEDGSCMVIIDEADILDFVGRNGLISMLKFAETPAVVFMTINKIDLVPNLEKVSMGNSYWIERGELRDINQNQETAA